MKIHFVCTGNVYRSRLAEAFFKFLLDQNGITHVQCSSSGIEAKYDTTGPISWYALRQIFNHELVPFMSREWSQTTSESFKDIDFTIFMEGRHYEYARDECDYHGNNYMIWDIEDTFSDLSGDLQEALRIIHRSNEAFELITQKCNDLYNTIQDKVSD